MSVEHKHMKIDRLGLFLSGLCLVHCLGTPALLILFPIFQGWGAYHHGFHWFSAFLLIPMAIWAVTQGYNHHKKKIVPLLAGLGSMLVLLGAITPLFLESHNHASEHSLYSKDIIVSIIGSICLLICHTLNIYYCRSKGTKPHCHSCH